MLRIDLLPAARGDSLWIEYGRAEAPHRILIDGGIQSTQKHLRERIERLPPDQRRFDLLIITHVDLDHIAGVLALLREPPDGLRFDDVWFNGWEHLLAADRRADDDGLLGAKLGERVSVRLQKGGHPWNELFGKGPVAIPDLAESEAAGTLPRRELAGGMALTLLSPTAERLRRLLPVWEKEIRKAGLEPGAAGESLEGIGHPEEVADDGLLGGGHHIDIDDLARDPFKDDTSAANGSSIAVLAEYGGKRCLLMGDAYASDVAASVRRLLAAEGGDRLAVDALKLSHHGGRKNTSPALLRMLDCPRYLFSTDGSVYDHPHPQSIARVVVHGAGSRRPSLYFNYRSEETRIWDDARLFRGEHPYEPLFPDAEAGISVEL